MRLGILLFGVTACLATSGLVQAQNNLSIGDETAKRSGGRGDLETKRTRPENEEENVFRVSPRMVTFLVFGDQIPIVWGG